MQQLFLLTYFQTQHIVWLSCLYIFYFYCLCLASASCLLVKPIL